MSSPLTPSHVGMIRDAVVRSRKVRRAAMVASASGWTLAIFALPALLFGFFELASALVGLMLFVVAWGEFRGASALRRMDAGAPRRLAINQGVLGLCLCAYGGWGIIKGLTGPSPLAETAAHYPEVAQMLAGYDQLLTYGVAAFYGIFVVVSALATGATAMYYASRKKHIQAHLTSTPAWIVEVQRAAA